MKHIRMVNRSFHYAERLKSNLLLAMRALDRIATLEGIELDGGVEVIRGIFQGLGTELGIARNHLASKEFNLAMARVMEAEGHADLHEFERAKQSLSEALSYVTTLSGRYLTTLKEENLI